MFDELIACNLQWQKSLEVNTNLYYPCQKTGCKNEASLNRDLQLL